jgi:hypothetical protein
LFNDLQTKGYKKNKMIKQTFASKIFLGGGACGGAFADI